MADMKITAIIQLHYKILLYNFQYRLSGVKFKLHHLRTKLTLVDRASLSGNYKRSKQSESTSGDALIIFIGIDILRHN